MTKRFNPLANPDCRLCGGWGSYSEDVPTAPHMPSSLPISVTCKCTIKHGPVEPYVYPPRKRV